MSSKKTRRPSQAKPGELKAQWGKLPYSAPDLCYAWGEGCGKSDGGMLHHALTGKQYRPGEGWTQTPDPSLVEELESRGYDITTLKFSIYKKVD